MDEFVTEALVVDKEDSGEYDARVFLYTEMLGGVSAKVTSSRKITSKLSAHLEPLTFSTVRLIQKGEGGNSFQVADALTADRCGGWRASPDAFCAGLRLISVLKDSGFSGDTDPQLWAELREIFGAPPTRPFMDYARRLLAVLGYDTRYALCGRCAMARPAQFSFTELSFLCAACAPRNSWGMLPRGVWSIVNNEK